MITNKNASLTTLKLIAFPMLIGLLGKNPTLTTLAYLTLPIAFYLLWAPSEPPALLFAAFYHWAQVITPLLSANSAGLEINLVDGIPEMEYAELLCIIGVVIFSLGLYLGRGKISQSHYEMAYNSIKLIDSNKFLKLYIYSFLVKVLIFAVMWIIPGITQIILPIATLHDAVLILLLLLASHEIRFKKMAYFTSGFEVLYGFLGFFSNFKEVFFYWIIALASNEKNLKKKFSIKFILMLGAIFLFGIIWQTIKSDYRAYISGYLPTQVITVSIEDRIVYLYGAIKDLNISNIVSPGVDSLSSRLGATEFVAHTINMVPAKIPYENGALLYGAISRMFKPRIFFPEKDIVDDSELTRKYAGLEVAGAEEGSSIGIGYFAESYVDFGPVFMFIPILLIGVMWGRSYRLLVVRNEYTLIYLAIAISFIVPAATYVEKSNVKIIGGLFSYLMIIIPTMHIFSSYVWTYIIKNKRLIKI